MTKADRCEPAGTNYDELIELPADFPFPRLALNPAQMALAAILPSRHGMVGELLCATPPVRLAIARRARPRA